MQRTGLQNRQSKNEQRRRKVLMEYVNDSNFETEVLNAELPVLVDFFADWCGPCKRVAPVVEQLAADLSGRAKVVKLNVEEAPQSTAKYDVMSIPTFIVFKNGAAVNQHIGELSKEGLTKLLGI
ncbi:MAG: thioredoxin [Lachnospiraceae bacterium]|nr:thioredoxin [Lachnospiraceae bacterium]